ncbi:MAG TPA: sn-glycerol-3-phosphate ABC transporter ATP-binding protein UgpC [Ignavibacteriaceae bacterium]|nr:sn-glycerol-3-phosphate ABC transporter ATP-binding protein UgpC [Ignavibacteriaceae bacterium]
MAQVVLKNIGKVYDNNNFAVKDVNIEVKDKEFVVLVGPSGCGKSTTLRMIAGLEEITEGELYIDNRLVNDVSPKDRDIAMVFQNYALYPHMSVYENMAFGLKLRKIPKDEIKTRVSQAASVLGLNNYLDRKPKALSGGERQRVAVGRAIVRQPKVFLFDEPLSNLDAKLRVQMRTEISKLHKKLQATMIYVTHDQTEAMTMGDRIVVMKDGFVQQVDTPLHLYNNPNNKFVAGFIGSPAMNFIKGTIKNNYFESGSFKIKLEQKNINTLKNHVNKEVWLGIRPEDIHESNNSSSLNSYEVEVRLEVVEPMGNEIFMYFNIENNQFIARVSAREVPEALSNKVLKFDLNKLYFFDSETELAIK